MEFWDIYDKDKKPTGRTMKKNDWILKDGAGRQVQRFIRLTNLIPELLDMVDQKQISFNPAVELSYPEKG